MKAIVLLQIGQPSIRHGVGVDTGDNPIESLAGHSRMIPIGDQLIRYCELCASGGVQSFRTRSVV